MALQHVKFLHKILSREIRITFRSAQLRVYSDKKDPCAPKPPCPPKPACPPKPVCPPPKEPLKPPCPCPCHQPPKPPCPCPCHQPPTPPCPCPCHKPPPCTPPKSSGTPPPPCPPPKPPKPTPCCPCACPPESCGPKCSPAIAGKVAVVTGGSQGIGYYCALAILKNGGKVMLGDVKVEEGKEAICKIIDQFGYDKAAFIKCDVRDPKDMECLFNAAISEFKQIDIVVNNAGILNDQQWEKTIDINVKGVIRGSLLGFQHMRRNKNGGSIINVASILGHQSFHGCPVYCGTKHFVVGFTRSLGSDYYYCQTGVKLMTLCPGVTITEMVEGSGERPQLEGFGDTSKELHDQLYKMPTQSGEACGNHIVTILEAGINGSDWISEGGETYRVRKLDRKTLRIN